MPLRWRGGRMGTSAYTRSALSHMLPRWILLTLALIWLTTVDAMTTARIAELRKETADMFYHGFDNYMEFAFPEDELRPVSCVPLTRDRSNPRSVELNDVLGNYSLTLIDSLSTLAILASSPPDKALTGTRALRNFQNGVAALVALYGDGTSGPLGKGTRARGFDVDSKVQVFETVIRGVGGLLSAHLFAAGELPITGYDPHVAKATSKPSSTGGTQSILWPNGFRYNGQLLRLALDLAQRLLPAFYTTTGMPYPRVNLRHGIPFYINSPLHKDSDANVRAPAGPPEITETCSAGAGSLVLEFSVLSRLTGDQRFEQLAKRAFWAVWNRRSNIGLIGAGIDAENGHWVGAYAGIGAGADSFFEYALKTHILLSGHDVPNVTTSTEPIHESWLDPNTIYHPLSAEENSPDAFLDAWHEAHAAIKRHLYSGVHHPHYVNAHLNTGSPQAYWIDSLGAYYPGLLTLAGEVEEAIETNLLYTALWTRYSALPERWSVRDGNVEGGLGWWPGRPEFIESNYHLYRATRDPWYLHVGEMVLKDIKRRCWAECGWSGLQDVQTGELNDRMESFFLGETTKYLYLLFDPDHPLNSLDAAYVFTTEGHPLLIPPVKSSQTRKGKRAKSTVLRKGPNSRIKPICPVPPASPPFTLSATAARGDLFHASSLTGLHFVPNLHAKENLDSEQPTVPNHIYYPWTLPMSLVPEYGTCDRLPLRTTYTIEFPQNSQLPSAPPIPGFMNFGPQGLNRLSDGILVKSLSGLKVIMIYESPSPFNALNGPLMESWRISSIAGVPMGRDEKIYIPRDVLGDMTDPSFTRVRDPIMLDVVAQLYVPPPVNYSSEAEVSEDNIETEVVIDSTTITIGKSDGHGIAAEYRTMFSSLLRQVTSVLRDPASTALPEPEKPEDFHLAPLAAITGTGKGAATLFDMPEAPDPGIYHSAALLLFKNIYFAGLACDSKLPDEAAKAHDIIVMQRGGCTFSEKLANIPSFTPSNKALKMVIVVSDHESEDRDEPRGEEGNEHERQQDSGDHHYQEDRQKVPDWYALTRPMLDKAQVTPSGLLRHNPIPMIMIGGGREAMDLLKRARSLGIRRRYHVESQGIVVGNVHVV